MATPSTATKPEGLEIIRHEIRYLSNALSGRTPIVSTTSDRNVFSDEETDKCKRVASLAGQTRGFSRLSYLFCLGTRETPVVAVTGTIEADSVNVAVLSVNSRRPHSTSTEPEHLEVISVETIDLPTAFTKMLDSDECVSIYSFLFSSNKEIASYRNSSNTHIINTLS